MKLINLTRHDVLLKQLGLETLFPRSGTVARITESSSYVVRDNLLLKEISNQRIIGLPPPSEDTILIVSRVVAEHVQREDLVFPDDLIVENGTVTGCKSLGFLTSSHKNGEKE